jgi:hypothetical protein
VGLRKYCLNELSSDMANLYFKDGDFEDVLTEGYSKPDPTRVSASRCLLHSSLMDAAVAQLA